MFNFNGNENRAWDLHIFRCAFDLDGAFEMEFTNLDCTLTFHLGKNKSGKPVVGYFDYTVLNNS